jgi:hypothetical protein
MDGSGVSCTIYAKLLKKFDQNWAPPSVKGKRHVLLTLFLTCLYAK